MGATTIYEDAVRYWFRHRHAGTSYPTANGWYGVLPEKARWFAREAIRDLRAARASCSCGGIDAVPHATDHQPDCSIWDKP